MSLLMDALRRAEASKHEASDDPGRTVFPIGPATLTLEDLPAEPEPAPPSASSAPDIRPPPPGVEIDRTAPPPDDLAASAWTPPGPMADMATRRSTAAAMFTAKSPPPPSAWRRRAPFLGAVGVLSVAGAGIAYYVWSELDKLAQPQPFAASIRPIVAPPGPPALAPSALPVPPATAALAAPPPEEPPPPPVTTPPRLPPSGKTAEETRNAPADPVFRRGPGAPALPPAGITAAAPADPLSLAHAALQRGERETAERLFQNVLGSDARNVDALLGLASLALDRRDAQAAEALYLQAMEANPKSAAAQAGLINLHGQRDPGFSESRLKVLLGTLPPGTPGAASVLFVLGNHYARQSRWNEAQRAYFEASSADSANPDYQFNLAVALEHLQKPAIALSFYRGALDAAAQRAASFDRQQARDRIEALSAPGR